VGLSRKAAMQLMGLTLAGTRRCTTSSYSMGLSRKAAMQLMGLALVDMRGAACAAQLDGSVLTQSGPTLSRHSPRAL
jgi:hypothetical protein